MFDGSGAVLCPQEAFTGRQSCVRNGDPQPPTVAGKTETPSPCSTESEKQRTSDKAQGASQLKMENSKLGARNKLEFDEF